MNLTKARELREERARKVAEARAIFDKSGRTPEDVKKFDSIMAEADALKEQIDREERLDAAETETRTGGKPPAGSIDPTQTDAGLNKRQAEAYRKAYFRSLSHDGPADKGFRGISDDDRRVLREFRDMGTGGGNALEGTGGGYFVPVGFVDEVEQALKFYGNMFNDATIMTTATGQPLPYPTSNDTENVGELLGEGSPVTTQDVTLGSIVFGAYKYSTKMVKVSIELLQDSAFDLDSFLKEQFALRLGRILNTHFTNGAGSTLPTGILTAAVAGGLHATAVGSSGNTGGSETGGTTIGSDDLIELEHKLDILYRRGAKYMMHDSTLKLIKQLKDKYGRPLWLPGLAADDPDTINGYEYSVNNDLPTVATSAKTLLFGRFDKYLIRKVKELSVLRLVERYADYGQVAFIGFARYDGNLLDAGTHPVAYLVQAGS